MEVSLVDLPVRSVGFIRLVWFNQTNETDQINEIDQRNHAHAGSRGRIFENPIRRGRVDYLDRDRDTERLLSGTTD